MVVLFLGGGKIGECVCLKEAGVDWKDGATVLPLVKKRREVVLLTVKDSVMVLRTVLGEAARADVLQSVGAILVLVRGFLVAAAFGVEPDAQVLFLHEGSRNSIDGYILEGRLAGTAITASATTSAVSLAGAGVVTRVADSVGLVSLGEAAADTFEMVGEFGPGLVPLELSVLPGHIRLESDS